MHIKTMSNILICQNAQCIQKVLDSINSDNYAGAYILADNIEVLHLVRDNTFDLIYIDPPFNTGKYQKRLRISVKSVQDSDVMNTATRKGFLGKDYAVSVDASKSELGYQDDYEDFIGFIYNRVLEGHRILKDHGSFYFHIDYREVHYCKVFVFDQIFGRENFINEIIWAYDYGGRSKRRWPAKHDNILFYVKNRDRYFFSQDDVDRLPYMAPSLVSHEKAALGKFPTDVWWFTIVPTNSKEKTGYPTQKPLGILRRIISASCPKQGMVCDFFAGSGTTGIAALELNRRFLLIDNNKDALKIFIERVEKHFGKNYKLLFV